MRVGNGFDIHSFEAGTQITLGGVIIPFSRGIRAHSDGDVLVHALIDGILGAINAGDIGKHFPDDDEKYKDVNSLHLLTHVKTLMSSAEFSLVNMDATIILEKPKLISYLDQMKRNIASVLGCSTDILSIKATTSERIGFVGRQEGIACLCSVLVDKIQ